MAILESNRSNGYRTEMLTSPFVRICKVKFGRPITISNFLQQYQSQPRPSHHYSTLQRSMQQYHPRYFKSSKQHTNLSTKSPPDTSMASTSGSPSLTLRNSTKTYLNLTRSPHQTSPSYYSACAYSPTIQLQTIHYRSTMTRSTYTPRPSSRKHKYHSIHRYIQYTQVSLYLCTNTLTDGRMRLLRLSIYVRVRRISWDSIGRLNVRVGHRRGILGGRYGSSNESFIAKQAQQISHWSPLRRKKRTCSPGKLAVQRLKRYRDQAARL